LADTLALLVMGMQQGLDLPLMSQKVSAGMWLLDPQMDSENLKFRAITNASND